MDEHVGEGISEGDDGGVNEIVSIFISSEFKNARILIFAPFALSLYAVNR